MMTAFILPLLIGVAGMAIDVTNVTLSRRQLQEATDGAALAVSTALANGKADDTSGKALGKDFVSGELANLMGSTAATAAKTATVVSITTTTTSSGKTFAVTVTASVAVAMTPLTGLIAGNTMTISTASKSASGSGTTKTGISMEIVLDESGSMADDTTTVKGSKCTLYLLGICIGSQPAYVTKIEALKQAATTLFDALDKFDPNGKYVRTGAISYTNGIKGKSVIDWGTTGARTYVNAMSLTPTGGTDATAAVKTADASIAKNIYGTDAESIAQAKKTNSNADRIIVLMTDGEMTGNTVVWNRTLDQSVRDECTAAKNAGIKIYTVAFMAPDTGKSLLKFCASADANYYEPNTMDALVSAFSAIGDAATKSISRLTN